MLKITTEFDNNDYIPEKYTCDGENINPEMVIFDIPKETKTLAIICDDPDAPSKTFVHWIIWNITVKESPVIIPEGIPKSSKLPNGAQQGINDFGRIGYDGPCPPKTHNVHHYFFKVYALNNVLNLDGKVTKHVLESAIEPYIISKGEIIGLYKRK
ncbi:MAG: YbhB/YbcL family Raf kinase inhibitor-like protein [Thermosipho sp. (in: Bacteria)]|nr:YbhB/YbcL family Raf kinase inhibitor-like protein [Thermosipho sp. (in: thermotogales)]